MNKENVQSVAANGTISLIEKYEIHSHPDEKYYNYGEFYSIVFRKKKGIMSDIYNVVERLKISQKNFNNIKEVVNNNIYSDRIEMYIKERLNKFGFSSENDYIFYVLKKDRILSHNPRVEKNTQNHMWIDKNELISGKDIVESVKLGGKNTTKVEFTGFPIVNAKINPNFDEKENKNEIISKMRNKLESIGFDFEKEQQSYMQKREFKELKFTHQVLINQFLEDGIKTNAQKFYLKALSNSKVYEIGFVTGKSSPLSKIENFPKPNALDSYDGNPAWTNREDDRAFDKLVKAINDYLTLKKASINPTIFS